MGLIDVADAIAADFAANSVTANVYFGPEFRAQDDAAGRVVIVPNKDSYDRLQHMGGSNPRPILTRKAGALAQIWAAAPANTAPLLKPAADWRALDALINQFLLSLNNVLPQLGAANLIGEGTMNTKTPHVAYGKQYDLQFWILHPIIDTPWVQPTDTVKGGHTYLIFNGVQERAD